MSSRTKNTGAQNQQYQQQEPSSASVHSFCLQILLDRDKSNLVHQLDRQDMLRRLGTVDSSTDRQLYQKEDTHQTLTHQSRDILDQFSLNAETSRSLT